MSQDPTSYISVMVKGDEKVSEMARFFFNSDPAGPAVLMDIFPPFDQLVQPEVREKGVIAFDAPFNPEWDIEARKGFLRDMVSGFCAAAQEKLSYPVYMQEIEA